MWNWYEYYIDTDGNTQYNRCKICNKFPALILSYQDDHEYGAMLCKDHWIEHVKDQFNKLDQKLNNEDWGSSPELAPQSPVLGKCEMCQQDMYKIYILRWCKLEYKVCCNCYDKYSIK